MIRTVIAIVSCALLLHVTPAAAQTAAPTRVQPIPIDRIVAVVNDEVITRNELHSKLAQVARDLQRRGTPLPPESALERQLLERMILDRAQAQFARDTGLRVDDVVLDRAMKRIAEENRMTPEQLREALQRDGIPFEQFREDIRQEILVARLKEREVDSKVNITDSEVDIFIAAEAGGGGSDELDMAHILLRVPEQATPEQIQQRRKRAEDALAQLRGGADFAQVAATFSDAPDALQGGSLGFRPAARLPAIFVEAAAQMKVGETSPVLRSANGFHIVKLLGRRGKDVQALVIQTHARHILVRVSELTSETEARQRLVQLRERIENGADFAELARLHSDDPSASRGGDLGWISPGDTVPEFERAMDALKPNEMSQPVQSPFGLHLIQVLERRNADVGKERQRLQARQALRARKADESYQEWLRQLRDRAYVEYRLEEK